MSDPAILFVKPKAVSSRDKKALQTAGVIVVEVEDPSAVKFVRAGSELSGTALLIAAAEAIGSHSNLTGSPREIFGRAICAAIQAQVGEKKTDNHD